VNDFVQMADSATLDLAGIGTIEAWVKLDTLNRWHGVIAKGNQNNNAVHNYALEITDTNVVRCILGSGSAYQQLDSSVTMAANAFRHLGCTWDGTTVRLYIDGVLNASGAQTLTPVANTSPLFIGQFGGNSDQLDGVIDEVRIYNQALTVTQIQTDRDTAIDGGGNTAPTITSIGNQTTTVGVAVGPLGFTVGDAETAAGSLTVSGSSSNPTLVPNANIVFGGSGASRTVTVTPAASQTGTATITVTVSDGQLPASTVFTLTVNAAPSDTTPPTDPSNLVATVISSSQINLSWTGSIDNIAVMGYEVERCQGAGCSNFSLVTTVTGTTHNNTGLSASTSYSYRVRAKDAVPNYSGYSNTASQTTPAASQGLRAAYAMSEGSGATTTADGSGNGNTGTLTNGPLWVTGKYGNGLSFDGVNDFVQMADSATLDLAGIGTIEAWVKLDTLNRWHGVIAKGNQNNDARHNYALEVTTANRVRCILSTGTGNNSIFLDSQSTVSANQFFHLACTWDGTTVRLYIDGVLNASRAQTLTPVPNTSPLFVGVFGGNSDRLDGVIDEVRIYDRALTATEIQTDRNTPIP
jgi:hypothetical protein